MEQERDGILIRNYQDQQVNTHVEGTSKEVPFSCFILTPFCPLLNTEGAGKCTLIFFYYFQQYFS